jgi:hypothetical protein
MDTVNEALIAGMLIGFGGTGIAVALIFWVDRILDFHWRRKRR